MEQQQQKAYWLSLWHLVVSLIDLIQPKQRTALAAAGVVAGLADIELGLEEFSVLFDDIAGLAEV
uniref:Uncharacterized protein n=1 Tax=Oryza meridionalis TaxID=40149 RepID=A0A0E0CIM8_9ORYZ